MAKVSVQLYSNQLGLDLSDEVRYQNINDDQLKRLEQSVVANVTWCVNSTSGNKFLCPKTSICTSDYNFCPYATTVCNSTTPFKCANGTCVSNPAQQCCPPLNNTNRVWCPHLNTCVNATNATSSCCSLNSSTPVYCSATKTCVAHQFDCCSQNSLVKCGFENKCAPANSSAFCFQPFNRSCSGDFAYQCPNDGTCKKSPSDCSSPRVCPPGYTTCPDYSCLPGINSISSCPSLPTCIIKGVTLARCSDGVTCTDNLDKCPTQVTCPIGQVVCPDNTCVDSNTKCVQPPSSYTPPKVSTCGLNMVRCADGECAYNCSARQARQICADSGLIQCPRTFQCAQNYDSCASNIYCPLASSYTFSTSSIICSEGPNICTWDASKCRKLSCFNPLVYFNPSNTLTYPWQDFNSQQLMTCPDGRCNPKSTSCMTEVSCSDKFTKGLSAGSYCHNTTTEADTIAQLAFQLNALACPSNMIVCLSGHCRQSVYDCPQTITCPSASPIQCQDGQCVTSRQSCASTDQLVTLSLKLCQDQQMLLCQSDLKTCVTSLELCPTMSTCPMGYSKCSENQCLFGTQCPTQPSICTSSAPFFCRSTGTCTQNQTMCPSLTTCPLNKPVKCASDQSCQQQIELCPKVTNQVAVVPTAQTILPSLISTNSCGSPSLFTCQDGQCRSQCSEWLKCPLASDFQCEDGLCVANSTQCSNSSNGCPFYIPFKCNFTAKCVSNTSQCANDTTSNLTLANTCAQKFGTTFKGGCSSGSCIATNGTCQNATDACKRYLYPNMNFNSSCFVPQCPPALPFKCDNGLCVEKSKFCPVISFSASQINRCKSLSNFTKQNMPVPCGDGSCVSRAELCPPLYECQLNQNLTTVNGTNFTVRCNDGTCRNSSTECAALDQSCPYRCSNGMCVSTSNECLLGNGCSAAAPNRCGHNGLCIPNGQSCAGIFQLNQALSFNAPKSTSVCYTQQKVTCISGDLEYCATNKANCVNIDNGCNVFTPVLCGGKCVQSVLKCATGLSPTLNNRACSQSTPFRCSNLDLNSCAALPFSTNSSLYSNVCSAKTQSLLGTYPINKCTSSLSPISCSDGSCVQNVGDCRTCNFFCSAMMQCTSNSAECQSYSQGKTTSFQNIDQQCPEGVPVRCILNGRCVSSVAECNDPIISLAKTYRSNLVDITCPSDSPLRCVTGKCVNSSVFCQNITMMNTVQMLKPIAWNATQNLGSSTCQVYCADGSCRDRQQNCPIAQACASPEAPYRCRSGVCGKNQLACQQIFGNSELEPDSSVSAYCYSLFGQNQTQQFFRCEDGTCRPAIFNNLTNTSSSTCLTYLGCPLAAAYSCPTGQCVKSQIECLQFSHTFCKGLYMCKNLMCVTDPSECSIDQSQLGITPHTVDFNPLLNNNISFIVADNKVVASMSLPSGSISLLQQNFTLAQSVYQRISFQVIPDWRGMNSSVPSDSVNYASYLFKVTNQTLSLEDSLLFPLFEMRLLDQNQTLLNFNATLNVQLNLPASYDLASDICLAMQGQNGSFDCVNRNIQKKDSSYLMPIQAIGVYAVIFSPDISLKGDNPNPPFPFPTPNPDQPGECNWYCQHKKLVIWLCCAAGALLLLIVLIVIICCCVKKRKNQSPPVSNNDTQEYLITNRKPSNSQKTVKYEKTNATETQFTEENTGKKVTLNDSSSDENDGKKQQISEHKMRKQIEKKLKLQAEEELRKEREQFQKSLEVKEQEIRNLKSAIKETEGRDKSSSPDSRPAYSSAHQKEELKKAEAQMREHFQNEVNRISRELIKQAEEARNSPPRKFIRSSKEASIKSYSTGSNYGSVPPQNSVPQLDNKNLRSESDLNEQWNVLMDEYPSTKAKKTQEGDIVVKPRSKREKGFDSQPNGSQRPGNFPETTGYTKRGTEATRNNDFKSPIRKQR